MAGSADDCRIETGGIRGFADANLSLTHLRVACFSTPILGSKTGSFNVLVGNRDDHAKNFTFLHDNAFDSWTLSPAYDLTRNSCINGEHAAMVNGKGADITHDDLLAVGTRAGLPPRRTRAMLDEVEEVVRGALGKQG